jgi:hypothetical protein
MENNLNLQPVTVICFGVRGSVPCAPCQGVGDHGTLPGGSGVKQIIGDGISPRKTWEFHAVREERHDQSHREGANGDAREGSP